MVSQTQTALTNTVKINKVLGVVGHPAAPWCADHVFPALLESWDPCRHRQCGWLADLLVGMLAHCA